MKVSLKDALSKLPLPATGKWPLGVWDTGVMAHGTMSLEIFAPKETDYQTPHEQDELYIVMSGSGWHRVGDSIYDISPGDVVFVPRNTPHSACCTSDDDMVIIWVLGGAPSLERAGYQSVDELLP